MFSRRTEPRSIASQLVVLFTLAAALLLCCGLGAFYVILVRHASEEDNLFLKDKLLALGADGANPLLTTQSADGRVTLTLSGLRENCFDFVQLLRTRLQSVYGEAFVVKRDPSTKSVLEITLIPETDTRSSQ